MSKNGSGPSSSSHNVIAAGTKLIGQIIAEEDFRIDGAIEGNINCRGKIVIGPSCVITGDIECVNLEVTGRINGNIVCSDSVILRSTAKMLGDIKTQTIEIEPGANFTGSCSMNTAVRKEG